MKATPAETSLMEMQARALLPHMLPLLMPEILSLVSAALEAEDRELSQAEATRLARVGSEVMQQALRLPAGRPGHLRSRVDSLGKGALANRTLRKIRRRDVIEWLAGGGARAALASLKVDGLGAP